MSKRFRIGIVGAKAYTARELVATLLRHPYVEITALQGRDEKPIAYDTIYGQFRGRPLPELRPVDLDVLAKDCDGVFLTLPHTASHEYAPKLIERGLHVFDLSADFRFSDTALYEKIYGHKHSAPDLQKKAVYALPELYRSKLPGTRMVACPGCYCTAIILAYAPLVKQGLIEPGSLIADAKSGTSGAGRAPSEGTHFCEVNEAFKPYGVATHRHTPEIEEHLSFVAGESRQVTFVPHLVPMDRGIEATCYATLKKDVTVEELRELYASFYYEEPFVRLLPKGFWPTTKNVAFTNYIDIGFQVEPRLKRVIVMSALDNLLKGAAGQAVQAMNVVCGWPETTSLI